MTFTGFPAPGCIISGLPGSWAVSYTQHSITCGDGVPGMMSVHVGRWREEYWLGAMTDKAGGRGGPAGPADERLCPPR